MPSDSPGLIPRADPEARAWRIALLAFAGSGVAVTGLATAWWARGGASLGEALRSGAAFAAAVLAFFVAHEAAHLWAARRHGIAVGPPWFTPVGVVMRLREVPADRTGLLVLGAAGPLGGVIALVLLLLARVALGGPVPDADPRLSLSAPLLWWVVGAPLGAGAPSAADPVSAAICLGALVTALNLLPFGQLDGGHVAAALWPERATVLSWTVTAALLLAGFYWPGWAVWAAIIHLAGSRFALVPHKAKPPPSPTARRVALAAAIAFVLCATPAPFR